MTIEKLRQILQENQPTKTLTTFDTSFLVFKNELKNLPFSQKKEFYTRGLERAEKAIRENARIRFIAATFFFDLAAKDGEIIKRLAKTINEDVALIVKSYNFARQKLLKINKPDLLAHSFRTASYLAGIKIDVASICAAMLHEVVVRSGEELLEVQKVFGSEIAKLIENFLKIRTIKTPNNTQYIGHLREMVVAMARDLRVVIIKMCSNIDRLKTFGTVESARSITDIAQESREILAPLANLLGIWHLRWQLEDLAFKFLQPEEYESMTKKFNVDERKNREKYIEKTINTIQKIADEKQIPCQMTGRFKHFYGIYQKMLSKKKSFNEICDVFALRIIVRSVDDCYRMLGVIHNLWKPKRKRIKDYIADPKSNNYKSLHTTVYGINGRLTEFQIRTKEMDEIANFGISAHWYYKNPRKKTPIWMQELLIKQQQYKTDEEFWANFSSDLLEEKIYVYTPKGDVIALPEKATPVDFGYYIHTEIGNKCKGAIVNGREVPLDQELKTEDVVEILLDRTQSGPKEEWLGFVKTHAAKKKISAHINESPVVRKFRI